MAKREFKDLEAKWQARWEAEGIYRAKDPGETKAEKFYGLIEFPYPSGDGLHVGHPRSYALIDAIVRKRRMEGQNVLYPIGWDAFGLPTENYAIKMKISPQSATQKNIGNFRRQLKMLGIGFDWSREVDTTDPKYYKWTQWQFLKFFNSYYDEVEGRAKSIDHLPAGLNKDDYRMAYKAASTINWCPRCKIGLANEEAIGGVCERCNNPVEKREKAQWMIRITKYADRLLKDLETVDYLDKIKAQQINWIGKSEGAFVDFKVGKDVVTVFTTRPDTLFGATYMVMAPEHPLIDTWIKDGHIKNTDAVYGYREKAAAKTEMERTAESKDKTGVQLEGMTAINPANGNEIPVWISDYVLANYGTGAIMAVPAHDERDYAFAKTFELPVKSVVAQDFGEPLSDAKEVEGVVVIGYDPKTKKYLGLKNGDLGWLIGGGREGNESFEETARRELAEEAGYTEIEQLIQLGTPVYSYYYNDLKKSNRRSLGQNFLAILDSDKKGEMHHESHEAFELQWVDFDELYADITKTKGGVEHWLDALKRAKAVVESKAVEYVEPFFAGEGVAINSGFLDGLPTWKAKDDMISWLEEKELGERATTYKLRDWVFSRQRYWGEPIPIIHCPKDGFVPVPEDQLPLMLPEVEAYEPTDSGESPLAKIRDWVEVKCPKCGGDAERETDTMPNWAGSSWYFLRYCDPHNDQEFASAEKLKYWMPVNLYNGGMEHTTLHLLYSRFWYKFLWDLGIVPEECGSEPYAKRRSHGLILAEGGEKMSKSKGNVINPDDVVNEYGADTFRLYQAFMGPFDQAVPWDVNGIEGVRKFLDRVWNLFDGAAPNPFSDLETIYNQTVKKVGDGIEFMHFNTCISQMMILSNAFGDAGGIPDGMRKGFIQLLAPFAPHLAEELWEKIGETGSVHVSGWPSYDKAKLQAATFELVVQVNGKVRAKIMVDSDITEEQAKAAALEAVAKWLEGKEPKQSRYVKGKLVSLVV
jgi:leucyl-tRNA synthetase